ncbi:MAG TPA: exosortase/archaeosortase family protein [Lacipirellulaceae bacterium]|nr:exosortase/archaeosortase family protein [Lacipirellulaceae bacterium]
MAQVQPPVLTPHRKDPIRPVQPGRPAAVAQPISWTDPSQRTPLLILGGLVLLLVVAYWDMFSLTSAFWHEGLYSHGWLVPLGALALLWMRFQPFEEVPQMERWIGLGLVAAGLLARLYAAEYGMQPIDRISFIPAIFGVFMLVGGMRVIEWAWPALAILVFMFPWPNVLERSILGNLQKIASICSTFVLQTMGISAFREGNLISIPGMDQPLNIAEACAGLRMVTIFGAMAVLMIFLVERPWWDKFVIVLSAIPIALAVNIIRITVTGLLYIMVGQDNHFAQKLGHDWAGYFMMPLALGFLWLELQILERVTVPVDSVQIKPVGGGRSVPVPAR